MKKALITVLSAIIVVVMGLVFAACGEPYEEFAGTYKFSQATIEQNGETATVKVGDSLGGTVITEDEIVLEVSGQSFTLTMFGESVSGTWKQEGSAVTLTVADEEGGFAADGITTKLNGNTVTLTLSVEEQTLTIVLTKVAEGEVSDEEDPDREEDPAEDDGKTEEGNQTPADGDAVPTIVGTYYFSEMTGIRDGVTTTVKVGDTHLGVTLSEDFIIVIVNSDGATTLKMKGFSPVQSDEYGNVQSVEVIEVTYAGTWAQNEDSYIFTYESSGQTFMFRAEWEGDTIVLHEDASQESIICIRGASYEEDHDGKTEEGNQTPDDGDAEPTIAGTYYFSEATWTQDGVTNTVKVGDTYWGMTITENDEILIVNSDGTTILKSVEYTISGQIDEDGNVIWQSPVANVVKVTYTGMWVQNDDSYMFTYESNGYIIQFRAEWEGDTIVLKDDSVQGSIVFIRGASYEEDHDGKTEEGNQTPADGDAEPTIAGTYYVSEMMWTQDGVTNTVKVGDTYGGITLTKELIIFIVYDNGTFVMIGEGLTKDLLVWEEVEDHHYILSNPNYPDEKSEFIWDNDTIVFIPTENWEVTLVKGTPHPYENVNIVGTYYFVQQKSGDSEQTISVGDPYPYTFDFDSVTESVLITEEWIVITVSPDKTFTWTERYLLWDEEGNYYWYEWTYTGPWDGYGEDYEFRDYYSYDNVYVYTVKIQGNTIIIYTSAHGEITMVKK